MAWSGQVINLRSCNWRTVLIPKWVDCPHWSHFPLNMAGSQMVSIYTGQGLQMEKINTRSLIFRGVLIGLSRLWTKVGIRPIRAPAVFLRWVLEKVGWGFWECKEKEREEGLVWACEVSVLHLCLPLTHRRQGLEGQCLFICLLSLPDLLSSCLSAGHFLN